MTSDGLFTPIFVPDAMREAVSNRAWLQAMLDAEAALAAAEARAGVITQEAAEAIRQACDADRFDAAQIGAAARGPGNPAAPLARALPEDAHWGATSQDIVDTAAMLVARRAVELIAADLDGVTAACARLAREHRSTPMAARTLLQQALPTTFGLKAATWLDAVADGAAALRRVRPAAQLGGGPGTLSLLGDAGPAVLSAFAEELGLEEPALPWHSNRSRIAELGAALALTASALGKVALDVELLSQTEVGEVAEPAGGGSSTMPHKRNPVASTITRACARRVRACAAVLMEAMEAEHERAAGAWHAEWQPLSEALALTGGGAAAMRAVLEGLHVDRERMRANLDLTGGLIVSEHLVLLLAREVGRRGARKLVDAAIEAGGPLRDDAGLRAHLSAEEIDRALDPSGYLGSAGAFVDRALER